MTKADKIKEVAKIDSQIVLLNSQIRKLSKLKAPKRNSTIIKRCFDIVGIAVQMRTLYAQRQIIISQPLPKSKNGSVEFAMIGKEEFLNACGEVKRRDVNNHGPFIEHNSRNEKLGDVIQKHSVDHFYKELKRR